MGTIINTLLVKMYEKFDNIISYLSMPLVKFDLNKIK